MRLEFSDKVVLVTGGSRGIGQAVVQQFAKAGAMVALTYNQDSRAAEITLSSLPGIDHNAYQLNQANAEDVKSVVNEVISDMEKIDILVNNAGIYRSHVLDKVGYEHWQEVWLETIAVNLLGPANLTHQVGRKMKHWGGGKIINISSRGAFRGEPEAPAYGASKAGLNAMSQSLAKRMAQHNVFVFVVAPGWVATDMASESLSGAAGEAILRESPLGRVATPDEVARTVMFLASEGTDSLTGCIIDVNGASYLRS